MRQGPLQLKLTIINVYERGGKCIRDDTFFLFSLLLM